MQNECDACVEIPADFVPALVGFRVEAHVEVRNGENCLKDRDVKAHYDAFIKFVVQILEVVQKHHEVEDVGNEGPVKVDRRLVRIDEILVGAWVEVAEKFVCLIQVSRTANTLLQSSLIAVIQFGETYSVGFLSFQMVLQSRFLLTRALVK